MKRMTSSVLVVCMTVLPLLVIGLGPVVAAPGPADDGGGAGPRVCDRTAPGHEWCVLSDVRYDFDYTISPKTWKWVVATNVRENDGTYGSFTVDPGQDIDFFVVDEAGYNTIQHGGTATPLKNWGSDLKGTVDFTYRAPAVDKLYFCLSNWDSVLTTVHVAGYFANDQTPPELDIVSPSAGQVVRGSIMVEASAHDAHFDVAELRIYVDDVLKKSLTYTTAIRYSWDTTRVADGAHRVTFYVADNVNNDMSVTRTVTVDNVPDAPTDSTATSPAGRPTQTTGGGSSTSTPQTAEQPLGATSAFVAAGALIAVAAVVVVVGVAARRSGGTTVDSGPGTPPVDAKVLVICPYCGHKNEQGVTKCQKCHADM